MRQACDFEQLIYTRAGVRSESEDKTILSEAMQTLMTPAAMGEGKKETAAEIHRYREHVQLKPSRRNQGAG